MRFLFVRSAAPRRSGSAFLLHAPNLEAVPVRSNVKLYRVEQFSRLSEPNHLFLGYRLQQSTQNCRANRERVQTQQEFFKNKSKTLKLRTMRTSTVGWVQPTNFNLCPYPLRPCVSLPIAHFDNRSRMSVRSLKQDLSSSHRGHKEHRGLR